MPDLNRPAVTSNELQKFLLKKHSSKEEFLRAYRGQYNEKEKSRCLFSETLLMMARSIEAGNAEDFKKVYSKFGYIGSVEDEDVLKKFYESDANPLKTTNIVILACKHNQLEILSYVLGNSGNLKYFDSKIDLNDEDEFGHNAIYYAILAGVKVLDTLINKWPDNSHSDQLDVILSKPYEELKTLKNCELSAEIVIFVENILVDKRFFSNDSGIPKEISIDLKNIEKRVEFLIETVELLNSKSEKIDQEYLFILRSIILNITTLKRFLKSTYNELPWEEIEFCLTSFAYVQTKNEEIDFFTVNYLGRGVLLKHLNNFVKHLVRVKNNFSKMDISKIAINPPMYRNEIVTNISKKYPEFQDLYTVFQNIRDIYSLESIIEYTNLASSVDCNEREGQLAVTRSLQLIGENLKNSLESPKLSDIVSELLLLSLSHNTRKIIINLRNSLSHANSLCKREELEKNQEVKFYIDIQNDIKKIGSVVDQILVDRKVKALKQVFRRIISLKNNEEFKREFECFRKCNSKMEAIKKFVGLNEPVMKPKETDQVQELVNEMYSKIPNKTYFEKELFNQINKILETKQSSSNETKENYEMAFEVFQSVIELYQENKDRNILNHLKTLLIRSLETLWSNKEEQKVKEIAQLIELIFAGCSSRLSETEIDEIQCIVLRLMCKAECSLDDIDKIEYMQDILTVDYKTRKYSRTDYKNIYDKKMIQLKELLSNYELSDKLHENYISYKSNKKLKFAVEMLVLDILSILGDSHNILENNFLLFEESNPTLIGKSLRNHLAHDNFVVGILGNSELITFLNARKIVSENLLENSRLIGKMFKDSPDNLKAQFYKGLKIIQIQHEMFMATESGNMDEVKNCLSRGAEIRGKDMQNSSILHMVCKSSNLALLKFILSSHKFDADSRNNLKQNSLHIAAGFENSDKIVEYLVEKVGIDVNSISSKKRSALHIACSGGHIKVLKALLKLNANTTLKDSHARDATHHAISSNRFDVLKILMENSLSPESIEAVHGFSSLHLAADNGFLKLIEYLLEKGVNPNIYSDQGDSPLHSAATNGHLECVEKLVSAGANVNHVAISGFSALHYAVEQGHYNVAKCLIDHGANLNLYDHTYKQSPIYFAAQKGNVPLIDLLVKSGAYVNVFRADDKFTPLMFAVMNGHEGAVKALIGHGAQLENLSASLLHLVQGNGNQNIVKILVESGVDINVLDHKGQTPLHVFCLKEHCYDAIKVLIDLKADINAKDFSGVTPIFNAITKGHKTIVELLIENNAKVSNVRDNKGMSPLHTACSNAKKNTCEIIQIMIDQGCDVNSQMSKKMSPLHFCVLSRNLAAVEFLINNGARVDQHDCDGNTPLMLAFEKNQLQIAKLLLQNGANIRAIEKHEDLLSIAVKQKNLDIIKVLLKDRQNSFKYDEAFTLAIYIKNYKIFEFLLEKYKQFVGNFNSNSPPYLQMACGSNLKQFASDLISKGFDVNFRERMFMSTPLRAAAETGSYDCAQLLLDHGAMTDVKDIDGSTPLLIAATHGHTDVVKILLERGANVSLRDHKYRSALEMAIVKSHLSVVKVFFEMNKVNLYEKGREGWTALHVASNSNDLEVFKYLLDHGYDVHAMNDRGTKPMHYCAREGFTKIIEYVIKSKLCTVDDVCCGKFSLLHYAVAGNQLKTTKFLIENGANVNAVNELLQSPLHVAADLNFKNIVQLLLENGAVFNLNDFTAKTPIKLTKNSEIIKILSSTEKLFSAVMENDLGEVKLQIRNGAVINAKDTNKLCCMHYACWKGFYEIIEILLKNKGNPNVVGNNGLTPLHYASKFSHFNIVITLLKNGAIFDVSSDDGKTALDLAENNQIQNILSLIKKGFKIVKSGDANIKNDICKIKEIDLMRAIM